MDVEDKMEQPVTVADVEDALRAIGALMHPRLMVTLPPTAAVNLPNIYRCLRELLALKGRGP